MMMAVVVTMGAPGTKQAAVSKKAGGERTLAATDPFLLSCAAHRCMREEAAALAVRAGRRSVFALSQVIPGSNTTTAGSSGAQLSAGAWLEHCPPASWRPALRALLCWCCS